jgi:hypothetical protein
VCLEGVCNISVDFCDIMGYNWVMTKEALTELIHEYNMACKTPSDQPCRNCWGIAGAILLCQSYELQKDGIKYWSEYGKPKPL